MNLVLTRVLFRSDGIFGELRDEAREMLGSTLEHAFSRPNGLWEPIIPEGTFECVRGEHYLHGMKKPFETFEVTGIDGHAGLLFHWGNFNKDSEGCILLGHDLVIERGLDGKAFITESRDTFQKFMDRLEGLDRFTLFVG